MRSRVILLFVEVVEGAIDIDALLIEDAELSTGV
jgi:hypothetical protein